MSLFAGVCGYELGDRALFEVSLLVPDVFWDVGDTVLEL